MSTPYTERCPDSGRRIVRCTCDRKQGDISQELLELVGWRIVNQRWMCPFCTGNSQRLKRVLHGGSS